MVIFDSYVHLPEGKLQQVEGEKICSMILSEIQSIFSLTESRKFEHGSCFFELSRMHIQ